MSSDEVWYCPLYKADIPAGLCFDINYERTQFFNTGILQKVKCDTGIIEPDVSATCEKCPNCHFAEFSSRLG